MTLETLAKDIAKSAEAEASAMVKAANEEAKAILAEATSKSDAIRSEASSRTEREATQIARVLGAYRLFYLLLASVTVKAHTN